MGKYKTHKLSEKPTKWHSKKFRDEWNCFPSICKNAWVSHASKYWKYVTCNYCLRLRYKDK